MLQSKQSQQPLLIKQLTEKGTQGTLRDDVTNAYTKSHGFKF